MGLMDKFKNLFTDEEVIEDDDVEPVEIKEIKKEEEVHQLPTFMREKIEKEEREKNSELEVKREIKLEPLKEESEELIMDKVDAEESEKNSFKFPIDFSENDFIETRSRQSIHHNNVSVSNRLPRESSNVEKVVKTEPKVSELYKDKRKEKEKEEKKFKATPIISPIYGVLDKNYTPVDMEQSEGENLEGHRHSKNIDFDSVRKKAYGSLTEEIKENLMCENCEYLKEVKQCQREREKQLRKERVEDNLVYEVLEDEQYSQPSTKDITLDEATENYFDYGVAYEKEPEVGNVKIVNHEEEVIPKNKKEIPPVKSSINLLSTLKKSMGDEKTPEQEPQKNLELTDDLFNLIDSMYDERNDS